MNKELATSLHGAMIRGYQLEELLGAGPTTAVYRARTQELWLQPELIVTMILLPETFSPEARALFQERFSTQAKRVMTLRHPNLFPLYGYGEHNNHSYLLTPDMIGENLKALLLQHKPWSPQEILDLLSPVAEVLDYLHTQDLVFQTFNPSNVLIQHAHTVQIVGTGLTYMLMLKGLHNEEQDRYAHLKGVGGSYLAAAEYLAPEVIRGQPADPRSDVYSLGILLFELLSGRPPFTGTQYLDIVEKHLREPLPSLHEISPDVPRAFELIINHALHRDPNRRFQSPGELIAAYARVLHERVNQSQHFAIVQTVKQIRDLPSPSPLLYLRGAQRREDVSATESWPSSALADLQASGPQTAPLSHQDLSQAVPPLLPTSAKTRSKNMQQLLNGERHSSEEPFQLVPEMVNTEEYPISQHTKSAFTDLHTEEEKTMMDDPYHVTTSNDTTGQLVSISHQEKNTAMSTKESATSTDQDTHSTPSRALVLPTEQPQEIMEMARELRAARERLILQSKQHQEIQVGKAV